MPAAAQGQALRGDAACGKLIADIRADCQVLANARSELSKLKPPAPAERPVAPGQPPPAPAPAPAAPDAATAQRIAALEVKIKELEASPFTPWCEGLPTKTATCDELATLTEIEVAGLVDRKPEDQQALDAKAEYIAEPDRRTATNASGTRGQREAVESAQPINLAGGAISLAGTRNGTQGIGTVTVNPLALGDPDDPALRRLLDLSITAPFAVEGSAGEDTRFVGVRVRANATAPFSSSSLREALDAYYGVAGTFADSLEDALRKSRDVKACVLHVIKTRAVSLEACGVTLDQRKLNELRENSYAVLRKAQREADRYYLGLDLRGNFGDPTGDATAGDDGIEVAAGVAAGIRLPQGARWDFELRTRAGGDYFNSRDMVNGFEPNPVFSFDWGAALVFSGHPTEAIDKQRLALGVGLEGRHTRETASSELVPTNFLNFNAMVIVPVANGGDLGLSFSVPIVDSEIPRGTLISVSTDLGLLDGSGRRD